MDRKTKTDPVSQITYRSVSLLARHNLVSDQERIMCHSFLYHIVLMEGIKQKTDHRVNELIDRFRH